MYHITDLGQQNPDCTGRYHGTYSAYRYGCRCPHAREAKRLYDKRGRCGTRPQTLLPVTGTARRIRALAAIGWPYRQLAARLDCSWQAVQQLALEANPLVHQLTANKVAAMYRTLCVTPGPSNRTRWQARVKDWHTPIAWNNIDDPNEQPQTGGPDLPDTQPDLEVLRRAVAGQIKFGDLHPADRPAVFAAMRAAGLGPGAIRNRLNINKSTYYRHTSNTPQQQAAAA